MNRYFHGIFDACYDARTLRNYSPEKVQMLERYKNNFGYFFVDKIEIPWENKFATKGKDMEHKLEKNGAQGH